jgi:putative ABC transport system permease protein
VERTGVLAAAPARIPAVVTAAHAPPEGTRALDLGAPAGMIPVDVARTARVLPRAGDAGALVALDALVAVRPGGYEDLRPNQVWLAADAPADFPARLAAAGLQVTGVRSAEAREQVLSHEGPALAAVLLLAGAGVAALLAAAGAVVNLHLLARRRAFELAAMRTIGVSRGGLRSTVAVEQLILAGFAIVLGVGLGVLGALWALPSIPVYADTPTYPPLLVRPDPWLVLRFGAGIAALLAAALTASGYALLRAATPSGLREAQA